MTISSCHTPVGRRQRAQSMVEFALVLPVMLLIMLGIINLGQAYVYGVSVQQGAREGARLGALGSAAKNGAIILRAVQASQPAMGGCAGPSATSTATTYSCAGPSGVTWTFTVDYRTAAGAVPVAGTEQTSGNQVLVTVTGNLPLLTGNATSWIGLSGIPLQGYATMVIL